MSAAATQSRIPRGVVERQAPVAPRGGSATVRVAADLVPSEGADVARRILALLAAEALRDGDRIPSERGLASALGAPRSVVREALRSLTLIGLLESHAGRGTFIRAADSEWVGTAIEWGLVLGLRNTMDLVETRGHLEVLSARLAAERRSDQDAAALRLLVERMRAPEADREELTRLDLAFHLGLARASGSEILAHLLESVGTLAEVWISRVLSTVAPADVHGEMYGEHGSILAAVEAADPERAAALMATAMELGEQRLREALEAAHLEALELGADRHPTDLRRTADGPGPLGIAPRARIPERVPAGVGAIGGVRE